MSPVPIFLSILLAAPTVGALLGDRIHAEEAPAGTQGAYAIIRPSGGERTYSLARSTGHQIARVTVIVFAPTFAAADRAATAIEDALRDVNTRIDGARVIVRSEGIGISDTVDEPKRFRRAMQFEMHVTG